jgi:putative PIN family toxin of toxin-antitoxin system
VRVVLDPNVVIAALLSRSGAPAEILRKWLAGEVEVVVSELLLAELARALGYSKLRSRVSETERKQLDAVLRRGARLVPDPPVGANRSSDPGDDYLLALAEAEGALLVSGDHHLLELSRDLPICSPRALL